MEELLRQSLRNLMGRLETRFSSHHRSLPEARVRSLLAVCILVGALAAVLWSVWALGWFGGRALAAASSPGLSLSPSSWPTYPGATFTVDVVADCSPNADAAAAVVTFDPAHLQVDSLTPDTSVFTTTLVQTYTNSTGRVEYEAGSMACHAAGNCPTGSVRLATIQFHAVGQCGYSVPLTVTGQITWQGPYTFNGTGTGSTVGISIAGDMDTNGKVDVVDIMLVAGRWPAVKGQAMYSARYDLDADGDIDVADIMFVAARWNQSCGGTASLVEEVH
jgi:hypothetical protein